MSWKVEIIEDLTGAVVKECFCSTERNAEKTFEGMSRNLNHARFSLRIVNTLSTEEETNHAPQA